ncbi:MAG: hypothetical protein V2G42_02525 [bacterium JZ-2024 1]
MISDDLSQKIRDVFQKVQGLVSLYARIEQTASGDILTVAFLRTNVETEPVVIQELRAALEQVWNGWVDVVPISDVMPPLYAYILKSSFRLLYGKEIPDPGTGIPEIIIRRPGLGT